MEIISLTNNDTWLLHQAAEVLWMAFQKHWPEAWPDLEAAFEEVKEMVQPERICRAALHADTLLGWVGGFPEYDGHVWELHPLAVHPAYQGQGVGRALVQDFEAQVKVRGGLSIMLGSDDEDEMTSLSGVDLYTNPWAHIAQIRNFKRHPYEFYQKLGYAITGVVPDANGRGKPDILMSKRVERQEQF